MESKKLKKFYLNISIFFYLDPVSSIMETRCKANGRTKTSMPKKQAKQNDVEPACKPSTSRSKQTEKQLEQTEKEPAIKSSNSRGKPIEKQLERNEAASANKPCKSRSKETEK